LTCLLEFFEIHSVKYLQLRPIREKGMLEGEKKITKDSFHDQHVGIKNVRHFLSTVQSNIQFSWIINSAPAPVTITSYYKIKVARCRQKSNALLINRISGHLGYYMKLTSKCKIGIFRVFAGILRYFNGEKALSTFQ
jgi:hypothetical protein